jgi:hypothetical protein
MSALWWHWRSFGRLVLVPSNPSRTDYLIGSIFTNLIIHDNFIFDGSIKVGLEGQEQWKGRDDKFPQKRRKTIISDPEGFHRSAPLKTRHSLDNEGRQLHHEYSQSAARNFIAATRGTTEEGVMVDVGGGAEGVL